VICSRVDDGIEGDEGVGEGVGLGVGLAAISSSGTASRLSVEPRTVCLPPTEGCLRLPFLQSWLARRVTLLKRDAGTTIFPDELESLAALRRCLSVISHCRSVLMGE